MMKHALILMVGLIAGISSAKANLEKPVVTLCETSKEDPTKFEGLRLTIVQAVNHRRFVTFSNVGSPAYPGYDRIYDLVSEGRGVESTDLDIAVGHYSYFNPDKERLKITQDNATGIAVLSGHAILRDGKKTTFDKLTLAPCKD